MNALKTAVVIGATGATGSHLVRQLLDHSAYEQVISFTRRSVGIEHHKLASHIVDFDQIDQWQHLVHGNELFSALGSTMKLAGSRANQYKIDYGYQLAVAQAARENGIGKLILVSSPNASSDSSHFYLRMKGELDDAIRALAFETCLLIKPSIIDAHRPEGRLGEKIGSVVLHASTRWLPPMQRYRPISAEQLARAMINAAQVKFKRNPVDLELDELFSFLN